MTAVVTNFVDATDSTAVVVAIDSLAPVSSERIIPIVIGTKVKFAKYPISTLWGSYDCICWSYN